MSWRKDPSDDAWYKFDWRGTTSDGTRYLASGVTIATYTVTAAAGLTKSADQKTDDDTTISFKVSGGTHGATVDVTCQIVTTDNQTFEATKPIRINERKI